MIAIGQGIPFPCWNNRMKPNGQPQRRVRPTLRSGGAVALSATVIFLAVFLFFLWRGHSRVIASEVIAVAVLAGGWFSGLIPGILLGLLAAMLVGWEVMPSSTAPAGWPGLVWEFLFFLYLGMGAGWLGARQRYFRETTRRMRRELAAEARAGTQELQKANAALKADIFRQKQTEIALRRSEAYLAEAERLSHTGSWAYDIASGVPVYWSLERCRISRFEPAKGHPTLEEYRRLHTPEDWEKLMGAFQRAIRDKTDFETDSREVLADGTTKYLHIVGHPVLNATGEVVELVGSTMDMTERKQTEEALHKAQAHLNHITHLTMMGELAASIAHEVNQPLAAVVTNANASLRWLHREPPDLNEAREAVQRIIRDGNRGSDVIARIRALLKKEPPVSVRLNINEVIHEIIALTQTRLRGITLRTELAEKLPLVPADRVHLQQVLLNLMTNAVDAMKPVTDRPRILQIQTRLQTPEAVLVTVEDSGAGVDQKNIEQLFEPFYTTKPQGLGMGLSISRSIIEAHGGRLWVEPGGATGATFRFTLPVED
jgi:C4-dicarboxylate-specific signal transduction histidine kinase